MVLLQTYKQTRIDVELVPFETIVTNVVRYVLFKVVLALNTMLRSKSDLKSAILCFHVAG